MTNIDKIISILKKEIKKFEEPIVTEISREKDPYKVLISCLLSLRTKDKVTELASKRLFELAKTPEQMVKLSKKQIERAIYPVGFYKRKALTIKKISKDLIEKYNSKVPDNIDELMKLKGVGRKTANIVLVHGFDKLGIPVDTHVNRISNRLGIVKTKTPEETEFELRKILPKKHWKDYNNLLVTWGQNICLPVSPKCSECAISKYCQKLVLQNPDK